MRHALTQSPPTKGDPGIAGHTSADCVQSLQRIEGLLAGRMNNRLRPYGLSTATFNVLLELFRAGGSLSPCDIGEQLSVTRGTVTGLLDSLERQRLVRRTPHPKDRRMLLIELTNEG
ncbi:MAG TPA: MarR family transcriptional regulator, partial [Actinomycetota bacterium]|nr:MarR family transcriptional regulator [Actinomycetota bacterium]